ncbi:MAG: M48 family metallopeptidase [Scytonema sp. PMC 1069.18]|nr:M48 family metallopeptidase [Scytonema sp. PMC 1069.18]MEC4885238.1 M48 family metallopeptidase [Scytonema sp. PMC 1070.18]
MKSRFSKLRKGVAFFLAGVGTSIGVGLATPTPADALPVGELFLRGLQVLQLSNLSTKQKVALGSDIHQQVRSNYRLTTNANVSRIGQRLANASGCSDIPFKFYVVQDSSINAFATTGGYVYVHSGLLNAVDNEAQLAGVLGHEIAHICNNDLIQKLRQAQIAQGIASLADLDRSALAGLAYQVAVDLPNSREAEFDADASGLQYMRRAGYNPNAMIAFLRKLDTQRSQPAFLSTHPGAKDRIKVLQDRIARNQ